MILKNIFFKLMNNSVFGKTIESMRKHRDINLVATERGRNYLVSKPIYHATKFLTEHLLATEMKKTEILMNKPVYFRTFNTYQFWYNYVKPKHGKKITFFYMDTDSFIVCIKQIIFTKILQKMLKLYLIFDTKI